MNSPRKNQKNRWKKVKRDNAAVAANHQNKIQRQTH